MLAPLEKPHGVVGQQVEVTEGLPTAQSISSVALLAVCCCVCCCANLQEGHSHIHTPVWWCFIHVQVLMELSQADRQITICEVIPARNHIAHSNIKLPLESQGSDLALHEPLKARVRHPGKPWVKPGQEDNKREWTGPVAPSLSE